MATIIASKAGNWSDTTVWTGGVLPGVNDYASTAFAITLDQDITVLGLRFTTTSGVINIAGSTNRTINLTAVDAFTYSNSNPINSNYIVITNTATTNINSYFPLSNLQNSGTKLINCNSNGGTINIVATDGLLYNGDGGTRASQPILFGGSSSNQTVNITGNLVSNTYYQSFLTMAGTNNTVNFIGDIGTSSTNSASSFILFSGTNCTLNITGTIIGNAAQCIAGSNSTVRVNINGIVQGQSTGNLIELTNANALVTFSGAVTNLNDFESFYCKNLRLRNGVETQRTYQTQVLNQNKTMYSSATGIGMPFATNVRNGVTYGDASQFSGSMIVPSPSDVRVNVPTDNTVGTADLTAEDIWNKLTSEITTTGSIGKLLKDNLDTSLSSRASNAGVVTELNTSSVDVAVRLRNASTVTITGEQIELSCGN
jgi:hypothetical protein